jgi:hypothetical protein
MSGLRPKGSCSKCLIVPASPPYSWTRSRVDSWLDPRTSRWHWSRFLRALPALAHRLEGRVDTHVSKLRFANDALTVTRWFYRQRLEGTFQRAERPWVVLLDSGCHEPWRGAAVHVQVEQVQVTLPAEAKRTTVIGIRAPRSDSQTIRPGAALLFVAGAGWTKKQLKAAGWQNSSPGGRKITSNSFASPVHR